MQSWPGARPAFSVNGAMMNSETMLGSRVLVLSPHTDDAELGCGASIARFLREGREVFVAVFSTAVESLPAGSSPDRLRHEFYDSMATLGVPRDHLHVMEFPVRRLSAHRQDVLEELVQLRRRWNPTLVLSPSTSDVHQDHQVVAAEGLRAFKDLSYWGYELPWNHVDFRAQAFITIEEQDLARKCAAMSRYASQLELGRAYFDPDFMRGLARVRGVQARVPLAEAFEVTRVRI